MLNYIIRRLLYMVVTLVFVSILSFILIELPPGSYLDSELNRLRTVGGNISVDQINDLKKRYGVDEPLPLKYWKWVSGVAHGDFGESFEYKVPVSSLIWDRLAFSLALSFSAIIFSWLISIPIGVYSATHRYTIPDYLITLLQFIGVAIPEFLIALILMVVASKTFHQDVGGL